MTDRTKPDEQTRQADRDALQAEHGAPQEPTEDEAAAADRNRVSEGVRETYEEATEIGASQQGEGRVP